MKQFVVDIETENSAFEEPDCELARILRQLADKIEAGNYPSSLLDINGNKVGKITIK